MPTVTGIMLPVGFRSATLFALDSSGRPAASSTTAYEGVQIEGAKTLAISTPQPRRYFHPGDDIVLDTDSLPPLEGVTGELRAAKVNQVVHALVTGTNKFLLGTAAEAYAVGYGTDKQGFEPQMGILGFQQAKDAQLGGSALGTRRWRGIILFKSTVIPRGTGMSENPEDSSYDITPAIVTKHLWGKSFATGTEGFTMASYIDLMTEGKPKVVAFLGDNATTAFSLPAAYPAYSASKVLVWQNGVQKTTGGGGLASISTTTITFSVAPATSDNITVFYEY